MGGRFASIKLIASPWGPRGAPKAPDPALVAADSRERGVFEALGLTLAGLAAPAVLAQVALYSGC